MRSKPTTAELAAAPIIDRWRVIEHHPFRQIWGVFHGHPELANGTYGHSSPVIEIEDSAAPAWAVCRKRIYRLGKPMGEAEAEIRDLAAAFRVTADEPDLSAPEARWILKLAGEPNQLQEIDWLLINLHHQGHVDGAEFERLYRGLFSELERQTAFQPVEATPESERWQAERFRKD